MAIKRASSARLVTPAQRTAARSNKNASQSRAINRRNEAEAAIRSKNVKASTR